MQSVAKALLFAVALPASTFFAASEWKIATLFEFVPIMTAPSNHDVRLVAIPHTRPADLDEKNCDGENPSGELSVVCTAEKNLTSSQIIIVNENVSGIFPVYVKCPQERGNGIFELSMASKGGEVMIHRIKIKDGKIVYVKMSANTPDRNRLTVWENFTISAATSQNLRSISQFMENIGGSILKTACESDPKAILKFQEKVMNNRRFLKIPIDKMDNYSATLIQKE